MMGKKYGAGSVALIWCLTVAVVMLVGVVQETGAVTCSVVELSPCLGAITGSQPPSAECCSKLKEQKPCLCGYLKDPNLAQYVNSPNAKKVAATCGVAFPKC